MLLIFSPNSAVHGMVGQAAAKPSYVLRPSSSASVSRSSLNLNWPASSLKKGPDHLPGSSKTPSSETYSVATSLMSASSEKVGDGGSVSRPHQLHEHARPESTSRRKSGRGRRTPPPRNANRPLADDGYDRTRARVGRVRRIDGGGLDDDDVDGVTGNLGADLAHRARDDHGHVGRKWTVRRRRAVAGIGRPGDAAARGGRVLGEALEAARRGAAAGGIVLRPLRAPESDRATGASVLVADDEAAATGRKGKPDGVARAGRHAAAHVMDGGRDGEDARRGVGVVSADGVWATVGASDNTARARAIAPIDRGCEVGQGSGRAGRVRECGSGTVVRLSRRGCACRARPERGIGDGGAVRCTRGDVPIHVLDRHLTLPPALLAFSA